MESFIKSIENDAIDSSDSNRRVFRRFMWALLFFSGSCCMSFVALGLQRVSAVAIAFDASIVISCILDLNDYTILGRATHMVSVALTVMLFAYVQPTNFLALSRCCLYPTALTPWVVYRIDTPFKVLVTLLGTMMLHIICENLTKMKGWRDTIPHASAERLSTMIIISTVVVVVILAALHVATTARTQGAILVQRAISDQIIYDTLPPSMANRLITGESWISEHHHVAIMFVTFPRLAESFDHLSTVSINNSIEAVFKSMDAAIEPFEDIEIVKSFGGDSFLLVGGLQKSSGRHIENMVYVGLRVAAMRIRIPAERKAIQDVIAPRVGVHVGPLASGLLRKINPSGRRSFFWRSFDVFGDSVNVASRMESSGQSGKVHCSESVHQAVLNSFTFICRGPMMIKGKGRMVTYFADYKKT